MIDNNKLAKSKEEKWKSRAFTAPFAPYGYFAKTDTYRKLIIDNQAASIVRIIFGELYVGKTITYVIDFLNTMKFATPSEYKMHKMIVGTDENIKQLWTRDMIYAIATNIVYTGALEHGKRKWVEVDGVKKQIRQKEYEIMEEAHEAIITKEVFDKVQLLLEKGKVSRDKSSTSLSPYDGNLYCGCCGRQLKKRSSGGYIYYRCSPYMRNGEKIDECKGVAIKLDEINEIIPKDWECNKLDLLIIKSSGTKYFKSKFEITKREIP